METDTAAPVHHRERVAGSPIYHLIFLAPALAMLLLTLVPHPSVWGFAVAFVMFLLWRTFSALRITLADGELRAKFGVFGPRIPVSAIASAEPTTYDWKQYGGWGIRYGRDGSWAYNVLGDGGKGVRVRYRDGKKDRTVLISSVDPSRLAAAIEEARGQTKALPQVRVAAVQPSAEPESHARAGLRPDAPVVHADLDAELEALAAEELAKDEDHRRT